MTDHTCLTCGASFSGGPNARYCPNCRAERKREVNRKSRENKNRRRNGSIDHCVFCGAAYTVNNGRQMYCPACQKPVSRAKHNERIKARIRAFTPDERAAFLKKARLASQKHRLKKALDNQSRP